MNNTVYLETNKLHPAIRNFLRTEVEYNRKDIAIRASDRTSIAVGGGQGYKGFAILANLETGECRILWGSWGGANLMNPENRVDLDPNFYPIPVNGAVISGQIGGGKPTSCSMTVNPANLPALLQAGDSALDDHDRSVLAAIAGLKSGPYRQEALARIPGVVDRIDRLVSAGLLKRNKAGSVSITTEGKNARGNTRVY